MASTTSELAKNLQAALEETKLTGRAASLKAGLRHDTVRNILVGRSISPKSETLAALADALDTTPDALLGRAPAPSRLTGDCVEVPEYDLSPSATFCADPRARPPAGTWRIPRSALPPGELMLVRSPVRVRIGPCWEILLGQRLLVDISEAGRIPSPPGSTFLVWDGFAHGVATLYPSKGVAGRRWELRFGGVPETAASELEIVGRMLATWGTAW
jgi:lambda repressor-like predicted transcriptional regulator